MAGTVQGGKAAAITNKTKYGEDFYQKIGAKGGKKGRQVGLLHHYCAIVNIKKTYIRRPSALDIKVEP